MKITWIADNPRLEFASFRLRVWRLHQELLCKGVASRIYSRGRFPETDVAIFQKAFTPRWLKLARELKDRGVRLLYNLSDIVPAGTINFAGAIQMLALADSVIVCSRFLGEWFVQRYNPAWFVIEDPYDYCLPEPRSMQQGLFPSVFWHGYTKNQRLFVAPLQPWLAFQVHSLTESSQPPWSLEQLPAQMARHEIGFAPLPIDNLNVYGKSSNKVVGYMAAGLAVIASDLPAYREVIRSGENGYLGGSIQDYNDAYQQLADPGRRQAVAQAGYEAVRERFSPSRLAQRLLEGLS